MNDRYNRLKLKEKKKKRKKEKRKKDEAEGLVTYNCEDVKVSLLFTDFILFFTRPRSYIPSFDYETMK